MGNFLNKLMLNINSIGDWIISTVFKIFAAFWTIVTLVCMFYLLFVGCVWIVDKLWALFNI